MKQDRFLTAILIGIGLLVIAALLVFFTRQSLAYLAEDTPEGVVHNYVLAVLNKDYRKAYSYLADLEYKPTYEEFRQTFVTGYLGTADQGFKIGKGEVVGDEATVEIIIIYAPSDPFSSGYNNLGEARLIRQDGRWKISSLPAYNFWNYSWYQMLPK